MKHKTRNGILLFLSVILLGTGWYAWMATRAEQGSAVEIRVNGDLYARYTLETDRTVSVGGLLTVGIRNGKVSVTESSCRNQICVRHTPIHRGGQSIVCLPQGVTVRIVGEDDCDVLI